MSKKEKITVQGTAITIISIKNDDYICLTDMAGYKDSLEARVVVSNWMSNHYTVDFLGIWEQVNNPGFNRMGFHTVKTGDGRLVLTPKRWVEMTNAIGIFSKSGRYGGGIFAHKDIAFEFGTWLSAEFKYFLIREFQRLKEDEQKSKSLEWNLQRTLSKINYRIHTDAIKEKIIPDVVTKEQASFIYADEADLLNVALFGRTAAQWRKENSNKSGNIRDYATLEQLVVLSNMESINALLIRQELSQGERLVQLNTVAITQLRSLVENRNLKRLK
ncbi:MAG: KilA-N domain-containing protein [Candidatus Azobacteroides sp.]|nr:KilA-N domain-containing protein [Candidatus Azobacteroides sp.]